MYDLHFRQAVINYYNKFYTSPLIADIENIFSIVSATLYNWINLHKNTGTLLSLLKQTQKCALLMSTCSLKVYTPIKTYR